MFFPPPPYNDPPHKQDHRQLGSTSGDPPPPFSRALPIFSRSTHLICPATDFLSLFIARINLLMSMSFARGNGPQAATASRNNSNSPLLSMPRFFESAPATRIP